MIKWKTAQNEIIPVRIIDAPPTNYNYIGIETENGQRYQVYIERLSVSDGGYAEVEAELDRIRKVRNS